MTEKVTITQEEKESKFTLDNGTKIVMGSIRSYLAGILAFTLKTEYDRARYGVELSLTSLTVYLLVGVVFTMFILTIPLMHWLSRHRFIELQESLTQNFRINLQTQQANYIFHKILPSQNGEAAIATIKEMSNIVNLIPVLDVKKSMAYTAEIFTDAFTKVSTDIISTKEEIKAILTETLENVGLRPAKTKVTEDQLTAAGMK